MATIQTATTAAPSPITSTANNSNHSTKVDLQASYQALISGLQSRYQPGDTFALKSGTFTRDDLVGQFQQFIAAAEATKTSHTAWRGAVQTEREIELALRPVRAGVRSIVSAKLGADGTQLALFGFQPRKRTVKSAQSKAQAVVKGKATRTARATKGKKQRTAVKATSAAAGATATASTTTGAAGGPATTHTS